MSTVYDDLSISLRMVRSPQHVLNGGPKGATFPGWFLIAQRNEGYDVVLGPVQLTNDEAKVIADVIDRTADKTSASQWRVVHAVEAASNAARADLERQLEAARRMSAKIPELERRLGEH